MLNIQEEVDVVMEEYSCDCGRWFLTKPDSELMICPKCGSDAYANGQLKIKDIILDE